MNSRILFEDHRSGRKSVLSAPLFVSTFVFLFFLISPVFAFAANASLFLSPITGTYETGEKVTVRIMVNTGVDSANAVEGALRYDPKEIEVLTIDNSDSILTSWTQEPSFNNSSGQILFAGGMSGTSSFSGSRGEILSVTFQGLRSEESHITFDSGSASSVHAADGTGGNLLSALTSGVYVFEPRVNLGGDKQLNSQGEVLGASTVTPVITSSTHPNPDAWYNNSTSTISWEMPEGVTRVRLGLDKKEKGKGVVSYDAPFNTKEIGGIEDGIWFVHTTREWSDGSSDTANYRLAVDTVAPADVAVSEESREDTTNPNTAIHITATDTLSGVDHYDIVIDNESPINWIDDGTHIYHARSLAPGVHTFVVHAFDRAGNHSSAQVQLTIEYIQAPKLSLPNDKEFKEGESLQVNVSSIPSAVLSFSIMRDGGTPVVEEFSLGGGESGVFSSALIATPGVYHISAVAKLPNGSLSRESEVLTISVSSSILGVIKRNPLVPFALLALVLLLVGAWLYWKRFSHEPDDNEDEHDDHYDIPPANHSPTSSRPVVSSGAVILGDVKRSTSSSVRATRL